MNDDWKAIFDHARKKLYNKARTYEEKLDILQNGFPTGEMKGNNGHLNFRDITTSLAHKAATSIAGTGKQSAHKIPSSMGCKVINELLKRENICVKDILSVSRFFFSKDNAFPSKMNNPNQVVDGVVVEAVLAQDLHGAHHGFPAGASLGCARIPSAYQEGGSNKRIVEKHNKNLKGPAPATLISLLVKMCLRFLLLDLNMCK